MPRGITAYDIDTAKEIADMWKFEGYETKIVKIGDKQFLVSRGDRKETLQKGIFKTHKDASRFANKLYASGVASEIISLDNGEFQVVSKKM